MQEVNNTFRIWHDQSVFITGGENRSRARISPPLKATDFFMLSEQTLKELQNLLQEDGHPLPFSDVSALGHSLVEYFELLSRNAPTEERSLSPPEPLK